MEQLLIKLGLLVLGALHGPVGRGRAGGVLQELQFLVFLEGIRCIAIVQSPDAVHQFAVVVVGCFFSACWKGWRGKEVN